MGKLDTIIELLNGAKNKQQKKTKGRGTIEYYDGDNEDPPYETIQHQDDQEEDEEFNNDQAIQNKDDGQDVGGAMSSKSDKLMKVQAIAKKLRGNKQHTREENSAILKRAWQIYKEKHGGAVEYADDLHAGAIEYSDDMRAGAMLGGKKMKAGAVEYADDLSAGAMLGGKKMRGKKMKCPHCGGNFFDSISRAVTNVGDQLYNKGRQSALQSSQPSQPAQQGGARGDRYVWVPQ